MRISAKSSLTTDYTVIIGFLLILNGLLTGCVTVVDGPFTAKTDKSKAASQYVELGLAYFQKGEYDFAIQKLNKAIEIESDNAEAKAALGLVYQSQNEHFIAEDSFLSALRSDPDYTRGRTYYAAFLYQQERFEDSLKQFKLAAKDVSYPNRFQIFSNIGLVNVRLNETSEAIAAYDRSLGLRKDQPQVMLALSTLYYRENDLGNADAYFKAFKNMVRSRRASHTPQSLKLGIDIARHKKNLNDEASLMLMLRNLYPNSKEYKELKEAN